MENPLKMIGPYIGAYVLPFIAYTIMIFIVCSAMGGRNCLFNSSKLSLFWFIHIFDNVTTILVALVLLILGFVAGWALEGFLFKK